MPTYDYRCMTCAATWEESYPIASRDVPCQTPCPFHDEPLDPAALTVERYLTTPPGVGYTTGESLRKKTPEGFKDLLRNMKTKHRGNTINV